MEILQIISGYAEEKELPFLLIGGHAVNVYGISRQTGDVDLVVPLNSKTQWQELLEKLEYKIGQNDDKFARFRANEIAAWPIDLMFVDESTFNKLFAQAKEVKFGDANVKVASARHLVTLKIHALKHYQEHRFAKDYNDIIQLLRKKETKISDDELKELCIKYANCELYDKIKREINC